MELISLEGVALRNDGPTLTLRVRAGESVAIMGPTRSGRTSLLRAFLGRERPAQGRVSLNGETALGGEDLSRRQKVSAVARATGHPSALDRLATFGLSEVRNEAVGDLSPGHRAAAEMLGPLLSRSEIVGLDGSLDRLDPWALASAREMLRGLKARGRSLIVVTDRPDIAAECDSIVVLRERRVRFAGSPEALRRLGPPHELTVTTERQAGVRALVAPFEVSIAEVPEGLRMEARDGQELAARLLREGYGDIRFIVDRAPSLEEGLSTL